MQFKLLPLGLEALYKGEINTEFSFGPFLKVLEKRLVSEKGERQKFFRKVLDKFLEYPDITRPIPLEKVGEYRELLELLFTLLHTPIVEEKQTLWALSVPVVPAIICGTDGIYDLVCQLSSGAADFGPQKSKKHHLNMIYTILLKRLYNVDVSLNTEMVHSYIHPETGLKSYCKVNINIDFVEITARKPLPELPVERLAAGFFTEENLAALQRLLPLSMISFTGFSVISLTDVTVSRVLEEIKSSVLNPSDQPAETCYNDVIASLKVLAGNRNIEFGLLPFFKVNGKLVIDDNERQHSVLLKEGLANGASKDLYLSMAEDYIARPRVLFFEDIEALGTNDYPFIKALRSAGVKSFAFLPVYHNNTLAGAIEIHCKVPQLLDKTVLARLDAIVPVISQLLDRDIEMFNARLERVIKEKFTSLQQPVEWRFREAAWNYIQQEYSQEKNTRIDKIIFKDVYPLYGAIDIRNSTVERNHALQQDIRHHFELLKETLLHIKEHHPIGLIDELLFRCNKWLQRNENYLSADDEMKLNDFLQLEATDFLLQLRNTSPNVAAFIDQYVAAVDEAKGSVHKHRHELEKSIQMINTALDNYFENAGQELQKVYPYYFEKIRTDGIEYDIYVGQSITPDKPFNLMYLKNLRLWQIRSMAEIARITHALQADMPRSLLTTQLIFVHTNTIDISFRNDERRLDVEGAYNIRYQVIKKRIDKVHIRNTQERLTQPGKIALVYFNKRDADEYLPYIHYLREEKILQDDVEYLELEDLQGVSGLRAIRVGVKLEEREGEKNERMKEGRNEERNE